MYLVSRITAVALICAGLWLISDAATHFDWNMVAEIVVASFMFVVGAAYWSKRPQLW